MSAPTHDPELPKAFELVFKTMAAREQTDDIDRAYHTLIQVADQAGLETFGVMPVEHPDEPISVDWR